MYYILAKSVVNYRGELNTKNHVIIIYWFEFSYYKIIAQREKKLVEQIPSVVGHVLINTVNLSNGLIVC